MSVDSPFSSGTTIVPSSTSPFSSFSFFGDNPISKAYGVGIGYLFTSVGAALFIYLIWAGIKYITSGGDTKKATEARTSVINAVIGIAIFLSIYTLLNIGIGLGNATPGIESNEIEFTSPAS
ncbi:hypothetical protein BH11PAT4_BH11PAT4_1950 [soil metagenome]